LRFRHEMRDAVSEEITATCEMTGMHLDAKTRQAMPWPAAVRAAAARPIRAVAQQRAEPDGA
jgi:acyl-CoA thioester hydrolase